MKLFQIILSLASVIFVSANEVEIDALGSSLESLNVWDVTPQHQKDALLNFKLINQHTGVSKNNNWSPHLPLSSWSNLRVGTDGLVDGLFLNDLDVEGDLLDLKPLFTPTLKVLQLNGKGGLSGDIGLLTSAPNLKELWLFNHAQIYGDVTVFTKLLNLINVGIYKCSITGDIGEAFEDFVFPQLNMFVAPESKVTGDVSMAFNKYTSPKLKKLNFLKVPNMACDLDLFASEFPELEALGLSDSFEITGSVESFKHCSKLGDLRLWSTLVKGDVGVFENMKQLTGLNLHHTYVSGDATFFEHCCPQLNELHLWKTDTTGDSERMRAARGKTVYVDW